VEGIFGRRMAGYFVENYIYFRAIWEGIEVFGEGL
jgi:hypothetical protein